MDLPFMVIKLAFLTVTVKHLSTTRFYAANDLAPSYCGANTNGSVVVSITRSPDLPNLVKDFYGFIRFRAKVK